MIFWKDLQACMLLRFLYILPCNVVDILEGPSGLLLRFLYILPCNVVDILEGPSGLLLRFLHILPCNVVDILEGPSRPVAEIFTRFTLQCSWYSGRTFRPVAEIFTHFTLQCSWYSGRTYFKLYYLACPCEHFFLPLHLNLRGGHQTGFGIQVHEGVSWMKEVNSQKRYTNEGEGLV